jgi:hypothetical protein
MRLTRAWRSGALVTFWALGAAGQTVPIRIQIVVYDSGNVGVKTLSAAESVTGKILSSAGLDAKWTAGPISDLERLGMDFTARTPEECTNASSPEFLRVQVVAHAPLGFQAQALGFSLPCATTGIQATLYADRVAKVSGPMAPTFSRVLGYAMAHELGHVLLHSAEHDHTGLMKGAWSRNDWQRAAVSNIPFSPVQARQIVGAIQKTKSTEMAQLSPSTNGEPAWPTVR